MGRLLRHATAIVMSTPEAVRRLREAFPKLAAVPTLASPVGFAGDDFAAAPNATSPDDAFRILHTGYLHTADGLRLRRTRRMRRLLGGSPYNVDILTRSHVYLLEAVEQVRKAATTPVEVHLAGVLSEVDREIATAHAGVVLHGFVPHRETVRLMESADLLFLPMQDLPAGVRAGLVPGKTYEYLASRRPILAAVPEGDARDLLLESGSAFVCAPSDVDAMAQIIRDRVESKQRGEPPPEPHDDVLARYERQRQAEELGALFNSLVDR
jgi:glycosyltransferase involved in cell wall biosynthesis